jgi:hypothetical protein
MAHYQEPLHRPTSAKMHSKNNNGNILEASDSAGSNSWVVSNDDQNYRILFLHVATARSGWARTISLSGLQDDASTHHTR